jgi:plasmid maintenance system antidote protein VapI
MSIEKEKLFNIIRQKLPNNVSFIEEVADVLDVSYDASYRRLNGKTALSFEEALRLAKYYKISLNNLYGLDEEETISVLKQRSGSSPNENLGDFFRVITKSVDTFSKFKSPEFFYAAKDIPIYYLPKGSLYAKFRMYAVMNIHTNKSIEKSQLPLRRFQTNSNLIYESICFKNAFRKLKGIEIWNDTTIDSSLYQIYYFYEIKMITKEEAVQLCKELKGLIENIERQASNGMWNKSPHARYKMYYNKLINLNNTVFFKSQKMKTLLIPYTSLSYLRIDDEETCEEIDVHFDKKLKFSKKISGDAEVERKLFFTSMYEKIEQLCKQIEVKSGISFM